jgi:hypothetical protein
MNIIEVIAQDAEENEEFRRDFDTIKEAREWVKTCGMSREFWNRLYERDENYDSAAKDNIYTVQLLKNGECIQDWFPEFD